MDIASVGEISGNDKVSSWLENVRKEGMKIDSQEDEYEVFLSPKKPRTAKRKLATTGAGKKPKRAVKPVKTPLALSQAQQKLKSVCGIADETRTLESETATESSNFINLRSSNDIDQKRLAHAESEKQTVSSSENMVIYEPTENLNWIPMKNQDGVVYSETAIVKETASNGYIKIFSQKQLTTKSEFNQYYTLLKGRPKVRKNNKDLALKIGSSIFIPRGEEYIIQNKTIREAVFSFTKF